MSDTISKNDQGFLDRHFKLKAKGTNVRTEIITLDATRGMAQRSQRSVPEGRRLSRVLPICPL